MTTTLSKADIEAIIPHKGLAVMIDGVLYDEDRPKEIIAFKKIDASDIFLEGHFPGKPVYPGHYFDEWICLAATVLFRLSFRDQIDGLPMVRGKENIKYKTAVQPGDFLVIHVVLEKNRNNTNFIFSGTIYNQRDELVASIEKIIGVVAKI